MIGIATIFNSIEESGRVHKTQNILFISFDENKVSRTFFKITAEILRPSARVTGTKLKPSRCDDFCIRIIVAVNVGELKTHTKEITSIAKEPTLVRTGLDLVVPILN